MMHDRGKVANDDRAFCFDHQDGTRPVRSRQIDDRVRSPAAPPYRYLIGDINPSAFRQPVAD